MVSDSFLCLLLNLNTLWYITMIVHIYVEQVMTMCCIQELQFLLSYSLSYYSLIVSDVILCPLHNLNILWYIKSYIEQVITI